LIDNYETGERAGNLISVYEGLLKFLLKVSTSWCRFWFHTKAQRTLL